MSIGMIFDLDGTLLDSLRDLTEATNYALAAHGFPARTDREIRAFVGNGARTLIRLALPEGTGEEWVDRVLETYQPYYKAHCRDHTGPFPGILEALTQLGKAFPLAVVSNKPHGAAQELCRAYFPGCIALGETPDCPRKPAPDMVCRAMAELGVEKAVYVGDSEVDVITAANAGVECLSVLWGFRDRRQLEQAGARHLCADPRKMAEALEKIADKMLKTP